MFHLFSGQICPKLRLRQDAPRLIIPVCKDRLADREEFVEHVFHCTSVRNRCETCWTTFKKLAYLRQHEKRQHASEGKIEEVVDNAAASKSDESESKSLNSDWDKDPQIDFKDEKQEKDDERNVIDISTGRIIRKRTSPLPVSAPIKKVSVIASTSKASPSTAEMDKTVKTESREYNSQVVDDSQLMIKIRKTR